jgi:hypothetical protein
VLRFSGLCSLYRLPFTGRLALMQIGVQRYFTFRDRTKPGRHWWLAGSAKRVPATPLLDKPAVAPLPRVF